MPRRQGDQIGRIFSYWATVNVGLVFVKITEIALIIRLLFATVKAVYSFSQEVDWATFWQTFSQTHLVTLPGANIS
jgi:hypothetical protein